MITLWAGWLWIGGIGVALAAGILGYALGFMIEFDQGFEQGRAYEASLDAGDPL